MSKINLTNYTVEQLSLPSKGQKTYFDITTPGFGVRVSNGGTKTFVVVLGRNRSYKSLGRFGNITLKEARNEARKLLLQQSSYPLEKVTHTPQEAISAFLDYCGRHNRPRTVKDYKRLLNRHFPRSFHRTAILAKLDTLRHTPAEQSHATTAFQVFLNWCVHNGTLDQNPIAGLRNQGKIKKRDRVLTTTELQQVWDALTDDRFSIIVRMMILTGQRKGEIPYITITDNTATIPSERTKNKHTHQFPVGSLTKKYFQPVNYAGWGKAKANLDRDCGVTDWTLHDLRRTYATIHAQLKTPIHVIEKLLNHISGQAMSDVAAIYNRYSYWDEQCEAVQQYEEWIESNLLGHVKP